jgi:serine/threonine protein kinase/DNA-binding winged helix-turn-helix (wHTH) protein/tetratricopeptide (TPR) repeat protein
VLWFSGSQITLGTPAKPVVHFQRFPAMAQIYPARVRLGAFEFDLRAGELRNGQQIVSLQEKSVRVLEILIEHAGEIATREEIRKKLWPNDTIVDFDHGINTAVKNLRRAFGDSADEPKYIETVARRGYRLMVLVEWPAPPENVAEDSSDAVSSRAERSGVEGPADDSDAPPKAKLTVGRLTGKVVSHYRVLEVIGGGGMGLVYRAEDLKLGRAVALKFLPEEVGDDPKARERFQREAHAVSALNHLNICTVYDFDDYEGHPFIAMELLQGKSLRDHIADGNFRLSQPEGLEIAVQIASGLEAAHEKGIIHRDIKPANIFITEKNVAKILDFGVAKMVAPDSSPANGDPQNSAVILSGERLSRDAGQPNEVEGPAVSDDEVQLQVPRLGLKPSLGMTNEISEGTGAPEGAPLQGTAAAAAPAKSETTLTRTGMKLGTAGYMSPEQIRGEPLDARTDIFSFGLVLYEMATGERAFTGDTEAILHDAIQHREPKLVRELAPEVSPPLAGIIEKCLEKEPKQRLQTASELHKALLHAQPVTSTVIPLPVEKEKGRSLHRELWPAAILSAVILVAVIAAVLYRHAHPAPKLTDKDTIVLADFENKTGDEVFDGSLTEALRIGLEQTPFLNLLTRNKVNRVLKQLGASEGEWLTLEKAKEVCAKTNSTAVVAGSIADAGNRYDINLWAVRCDTGASIADTRTSAKERNLIVKELGLAAIGLREQLGEPLNTIREFNQPLEVAATPWIESLKEFTEGDRIRPTMGDGAAMEHFRHATEIDPSFAYAYTILASCAYNSAQRATARESATRAYELRNKATRRQKLHIEGNYFNISTGEDDQAVAVLTETVREYPYDFGSRNNLSRLLRVRGLYERAATQAREAIVLNPESYPPYYNLMFSQVAMGQLGAASSTFEDARSHGIDNEMLRDARYTVAFIERDTKTMEEQIQWTAQRSMQLSDLFWEQFFTPSYFGQRKKARRFAIHALEGANSTGFQEPVALAKLNVALAEVEVGNASLARDGAMNALSPNSTTQVRLKAALVLARSGEPEKAENLARQVNAEMPQDTHLQNYDLPCIRAAIAIGHQQPAKAVEQLKTAPIYEMGQDDANLYSAYLRGVAYLQLNQGQEANTEFQKITEHPGIVMNNVWGALAHLQLARAYAMMGDKEAARKSYQDFLTLWKDADPDIPIYRQAKAEYKRLNALQSPLGAKR